MIIEVWLTRSLSCKIENGVSLFGRWGGEKGLFFLASRKWSVAEMET